MSNIVDTNPSIMKRLRITSLWAREEIFTIMDYSRGTVLIYDFERRRVDSRCIVRAIDCSTRTMSEMRSRTLRFRIKSTFAPLPGEDEGVTFTGGGFTASVITKDNTYRLISALPDFVLPSGEKGLKTLLEFHVDSNRISFNQIYSKNRFTEAIHSSLSPAVNGTVTVGGGKRKIEEGDFTALRVWKATSFPIRRDSYSSYCYGRRNGEPFAFTLSVEEEKCLLLYKDTLIDRENMRMERVDDTEYRFTNGKDTGISFSVFSVSKEKTGPFRRNRVLKYGLFKGRIGDFSFSESFGCIEL